MTCSPKFTKPDGHPPIIAFTYNQSESQQGETTASAPNSAAARRPFAAGENARGGISALAGIDRRFCHRQEPRIFTGDADQRG
jgi:hypothetical protein